MSGVAALRFRVGARTIATIPRRLIRVACDLDDVLAARVPPLPPLGGADGYLATSVPEGMAPGPGDLIVHVRQRYRRFHVDLTVGEAAWRAQLSGNARSALTRKARRLGEAGRVAVRRYRTPDELAAFHPPARAISALTYQERLLDAGLPEGADWAGVLRLAAGGDVRAWLLSLDDAPVAYLCCTAQGRALRYDFVGHDPAFDALSPGAVLQHEALRDLFAEGAFGWFDFTEGEGQHKRQLATGSTPCADLLLLRPTLANRAAVGALAGFDAGVAWGKRIGGHPALAGAVRALRR